MIRFFRHFGEAVKGLFRNGVMSFLATFSVGLTLTLLAFFSVIVINTERLTRGVEGSIEISTFLVFESTDNQETITNEQGETVPNPDYHAVYNQILALSNVKSVRISTKEEQLEELKENMGSAWEIYEQDNPLSDVYVVSTTSPDHVKSVAAAIKDIPGVEEANYGGLETDTIFKLADTVRIWGLVATLIILVLAVFFISNTIRMTIVSRRREIQIMRLVGAKAGYIRGPFFIEGALIGLLGSFLPSLLVYFGYHFLYEDVNTEFIEQGLSLYPPEPFVYIIMGGLVIVGIFIGSIGSNLSTRKYLKF